MAFVMSVILTHVLTPRSCNRVTLVAIFAAVVRIFISDNLNATLVRGGSTSSLSFSSIFCFGFMIYLILCTVVFVTTPIVTGFCGSLSLVPVVQIVDLAVIVSNIGNVRRSCISQGVLFGHFFCTALNKAIFSTFLNVKLTCTNFNI